MSMLRRLGSVVLVALLVPLSHVLPAQSAGEDPSVPGRAAEPARRTAPGVTAVRSGFDYSPIYVPRDVSAVGDNVFFPAREKGGETYTLWRTDGSDAGTIALPPGRTPLDSDGPRDITSLGNVALFVDHDQLWRSDGAPAGTYPLPGVTVWELPGEPCPGCLQSGTTAGGVAYFTDRDGNPWRSDGSTAGTFQLASNPNPAAGSRWVHSFTASGSQVYWLTAANGVESLWTSDGTVAGTREIALPASDLDLGHLQAVGANVYFVRFEQPAYGSSRSVELWRSDGTEAGTLRVLEQSAPERAPDIGNLTSFGGALYFTLYLPGAAGSSLWRSDGSAAGTGKVTDVGFPRTFAVSGSKLFFVDGTEASAAELWVSDGTGAGTSRVAGLGSDPNRFVAHEGRVYYFGADANGRGIWVSDGTAAGTRRVDDLAWQGTSYPIGLTATGRDVFFLKDSGGRDSVRNIVLYKLGGAAAPTRVRATAPTKVRARSDVRIPLKLRATSDISVRVRTRVKLGASGASVALRSRTVALEPGQVQRLSLRGAPKASKRLMKAIRAYRMAAPKKKRRAAVVAVIVAKGTDFSGRRVSTTRTMKLV